MLFVPGDSERKFTKASSSGADALILDLEDAVASSRKEAARYQVAARIDEGTDRTWRLFVRPNPFETGMALDDMAAVVRPGLDGLVIPKANGAHDVARVGVALHRLEHKAGMEPGSVKLVVVATETPAAMFNLGSYAPRDQRLVAMTWGAEDLAAAVGATDNKEADGSWTFPYQLARAQCLFAAAAAEALPIDTLYANFRDPVGLENDCRRARRDGFVGRIAIHPDQVGIINHAFSPSPEQLAHAQEVVAAFAAAPDAGTVGLNGMMLDIPHLKAAMRTLAGA